MWSAPAPFTVVHCGVPITCQAGTHGFNAIAGTCDPMDDHNHGTHVSGTIGAVGNNARWRRRHQLGVVADGAEVSWPPAAEGTIADAVDAIDFAIQVKTIFAGSGGANIRILSNSWGGGGFFQAIHWIR